MEHGPRSEFLESRGSPTGSVPVRNFPSLREARPEGLFLDLIRNMLGYRRAVLIFVSSEFDLHDVALFAWCSTTEIKGKKRRREKGSQ